MIGIFVRQYELEKKPLQQMQLIEEDIVTKKSTKIDGLEPYFLLPLSTLLLLYSKMIGQDLIGWPIRSKLNLPLTFSE